MMDFNPKTSSNRSCAFKKDIDLKKLETVDVDGGYPNSLLVLGVPGTIDLEVGVLVPNPVPPSPLTESLSSFAPLSNISLFQGEESDCVCVIRFVTRLGLEIGTTEPVPVSYKDFGSFKQC